MLRLGALPDGLLLEGLNMLDSTAEVSLEFRVVGWRDELKLSFGSFQRGFFEVGIVVTMCLQEETICRYGTDDCTSSKGVGGVFFGIFWSSDDEVILIACLQPFHVRKEIV